MGTKYAAVSISGYDALAPPDDGTVSEQNKLKWSTIKTKLPDPLKTAIETIDSRLQTHVDIGPNAYTSNQTLGAAHHNQVSQVSGAGVTLTLTDAAALTTGWFTRVVNTDTSNSVTIGRATSGDTINGSAADFTLPPNTTIDIFVIAAATGFRVISFATTDGTQTLTNKTLSSPTLSGTVAGSPTVSGSWVFNSITPIDMTATDNGAGSGPVVDIRRISASPAASDLMGQLRFLGRDSAANDTSYASIIASIVDPTDTSEDAELIFNVTSAGTGANAMRVGAGVRVGAPTGGDKGAGTLNAETNLYVANDPVVTETGTQTLTNKTLTSPTVNTPTVNTPTITTPAISNGTLTGTLTNSGTISGGTVNPTTLQQGGVQAVTTTDTQTLTNKTLTSPVINSATGIGQSIVVRKTAPETVETSTTIQDDNELIFSIGANETWVAEYYLDIGTNLSAHGFKFAVTVPTGETAYELILALVTDAIGEAITDRTSTAGGELIFLASAFTSATNGVVRLHLSVVNGATPGSATLQWAQGSSNVANALVRRGSHLIAHRVA